MPAETLLALTPQAPLPNFGVSTPYEISTPLDKVFAAADDDSQIIFEFGVSDSSGQAGNTAPRMGVRLRASEWRSAPNLPLNTPAKNYRWAAETSDVEHPERRRVVLFAKGPTSVGGKDNVMIRSPDRENIYLTYFRATLVTRVTADHATATEVTGLIDSNVKDYARTGGRDISLGDLLQTDRDRIDGSADASTMAFDDSGRTLTISDNEGVPKAVSIPEGGQTEAQVDARVKSPDNAATASGRGNVTLDEVDARVGHGDNQAAIDARVKSPDNAATGVSRGNIELATSDETIAGADQQRAVTPKAAKDARDNALKELLTFETALKETAVLVTNQAVTQNVSGASAAFAGRPKLPANEFDRRLYGTINGSLAFGIFIKDLENLGGVGFEGAQLNSGNSLQIRNIELAENYFISFLSSDRTLLFASDTAGTYRVTVAESHVDLEDYARRSKTDVVPVARIGTGTKNANTVYHGDGTFKPAAAGGIGGITVKDEGSGLGSASTVDSLNFTGNAVTATRSGNEVSVDVQASSGGSARTGFIEKVKPAAASTVSSVNGAWSDWSTLITATAITAEQAGQVLILVDTHAESVGTPSGGGDRIISGARLVRTRGAADTEFPDKEIYGPRNLQGGNANTSAGFQTATTKSDFSFAVADDALEGDVYKVQVRIIAQKPNETQAAEFSATYNQLTLCSLGGAGAVSGGGSGLTTSQVNALIASYARATPTGRIAEAQLPKKLDDILDAINLAGWDDLETSSVSTPKSTAFVQADFTGLVWVTSRSESPARATSYYPVRILLADKRKVADKLLRLGVFDSTEGVEESTVNLAHVFDDSTYAYYSVRIPQVGEAEVVKVQEYEPFEINEKRLGTLPTEDAVNDQQYINRQYQWVDIPANLTGRLLQDGPGTGFSPTGATSGRTALTGFTNNLDLDNETGGGIIEVEGTYRISTGKTATLGFGATHDESVRLTDIVSLSSLRSSTAYSGSTDNGVQIGSFDIYSGNARVQTNRLFLAKDGNNNVGVYTSWTRLANFTALGIGLDLEVLFLPADAADTSMFLTQAQVDARAVAQIRSSANEANSVRRGTVRVATQSQAEAGAVNDRVMTPVRTKQLFDAQPSASPVKLWGRITSAGAISESSGGFSISRSSTGRYRVSFSTSRANNLYAVVGSTLSSAVFSTSGNDASGFNVALRSISGGSSISADFSFALLDL